MISTPGPRAPHQGTPGLHHAPNAALLIDFDNVTMGIRSDLGKELKALLSSDVIRGKVAVQRAYADWRRYPQYIVPLAESSIDLIFAPAYGSSKKNATDLRMAIDAMELVFTRPEIGTFILMTGDSDFSSCVLKLKEYGKYVIGVGMRESSSDLLIQNCDEYYSYHALSGLTRAGEVEESKEDPWVLAKRAAQQMSANGDVMRTDRLKQVMLDLDPGFDEKKIGYSKFSRFVQQAAEKGMFRLRKTENGQHEIAVGDEGAPAPRAESSEGGNGRRDRDRDRGRGRRGDRDRGPRTEQPRAQAAGEEQPRPEQPLAEQPVEERAAAERPRAEEPPARVEPLAQPAAEQDATPTLARSHALLQEAVRQLATSGNRSVRDGDVKRKMLELDGGFDEAELGFPKFTRFLRQAHDAEIVDLQRSSGGNYEVSLPASGKRLPAPTLEPRGAAPAAATAAPRAEAERAAEPTPTAQPQPTAERTEVPAAAPAAGRGIRGRRGGRPGAAEGPPPLLPGQVVQVAQPAPEEQEPTPTAEAEPEAAAAPSADEAAKKSRRGRRGGRGKPKAEPAVPEPTSDAVEAPAADAGEPAAAEEPVAQAPVTEAAPEAAPATPEPTGRRGRRGRGRPGTPDSMPPILPGQVMSVPAAQQPAEEATPDQAPAAAADAAADAEQADDGKKRRRGRGGRGRKAADTAAAETAAESAAAPAAPSFSAEALGLPRDRGAIEAYLTNSYKGVGKKTAEQLLDAIGTDVFQAMEEQPQRVHEALGDRRAGALLEQWSADVERRREQASAAPAEEPAQEAAPEDAPPKKARSRRGGRGRGGRKKGATPSA